MRSTQALAVRDRRLLLVCAIMIMSAGIFGCVSPDVIDMREVIDMRSFDPSQDQRAIAGYYRNQAMAMRERAHAQTTAAARYEGLFGPEADLVSGARLLAGYYGHTADELERRAEAHAAVARTGQRPATVP